MNTKNRSKNHYSREIFKPVWITFPVITLSLLVSTSYFRNHANIVNIVSSIILFLQLKTITLEDIRSMLIDKNICIIGILSGLSLSLLSKTSNGFNKGISVLYEHLLTTIIVLFLMLTLCWISKLVFHKEALGIGDAWVTAMGGAWLGIDGIIDAVSLAFLSAGLVGLLGRLSGYLNKFEPFPFAPYICISIWTVWIFR